MQKSNTPSSVTLIFYRLGPLSSEPFLNIVASAVQFSSLCHCEIAIGESVGANGQMVNVARVFNDAVGVELAQRTGRNPRYSYLQLGCSELAVRRMLEFARAQVGKPFSQVGMARSIVFPRQSDHQSWFCAELTAAILQVGGLLNSQSNPGAATPSSLYAMYQSRAAVAANPWKLHLLQQQQQQQQQQHRQQLRRTEDTEPLLQLHLRGALRPVPQSSESRPQRQHFRQISNDPPASAINGCALSGRLTLHSLGQP